MTINCLNSYETQATLSVGEFLNNYHSLKRFAASKRTGNSRLPYSIRALLERLHADYRG
jgi:aconitase A